MKLPAFINKLKNNYLYLYFLLFTVVLLKLLFDKQDLLFVSAIVVFAITFKFSLDISERMKLCLTKISNREIIAAGKQEILLNQLEKRASFLGNIVGCLVGLAVFLGWTIEFKFSLWNIFLIF